MVGIAVVGAGYWGPNLIRNFSSLGHLEGIVDQDEKRLAKLRNQYPGVACYTRMEDVLECQSVQGVALATPASSHYSLAKKVISGGKSVFVEKPLAQTTDECRDLISLSKKHNAVLMVGHTFEYNSAVHYVEECINRRELGQIYYIYSQRLNLGVVRSDINALWNLAPHDISIVLRWLKQRPLSVDARGFTYLQDGIEDVVYLNMEFPDGVSVHIHVSWLDPSKVRRITLVGSEKMIVYDDASSDSKIMLYDKGIDRFRLDGSLGAFDTFAQFQLIQRAGDVVIPRIEYSEPLRAECKHFVECITENKQPTTDGDNGLRVVEVLEAASRSLALGGERIELS